MARGRILGGAAAAVVLAAVLVACGGGSGPAVSTPATAQLQGTVVDGGSAGGRVFLDLNGNGSHDAGEPIGSYAPDGEFELDAGARNMAELASAVLVAEPAGPKGQDSLSETPKLMAPATAFLQSGLTGYLTARQVVISPLTTLVAAEVLANGLTAEQAKKSVGKQLGLGDADPLANYIAAEDRQMGLIAQATSVALTQSAAAAGASPHEAMQAMAALQPQLAGVVRTLQLDQPGRQAPRKEEIAQALAAQPAMSATLRTLSGSEPGQPVRLIVRLKDGVRGSAEKGRTLAGRHGGEMRHSFSKAINGFAVTVPESQAEAFLNETLASEDVESVEVDRVVTTLASQSNATWGLDRVDQRSLPLDGSYSYARTANRVRAYILDTGIRADHRDFGGRVEPGFTAISDGMGTDDCHGHGTHVAGTVGGKTWGVAKEVNLVPVRVLDCFGSGYVSGIVAALDWMVENAERPAVANMSLGGWASDALDDAVERAVAAGITVVVAAGNDSANACNYSPARASGALTVGASASDDSRAYFSNYGTCLDLFAPGDGITSAGIGSDRASRVLSGTSMAAPHVAGLAALYLHDNNGATPDQVAAAIVAAATTNKLTDGGAGSPDALMYSNLSNPAPQPSPPISSPISSPISAPISSPEPPPPAVPTVAIGALTGYTWLDRGTWRSSFTVTVVDGSGALVPKAKVKGLFTPGGKKAGCTTAANGTCVISGPKLKLDVLEITLSISEVSKRGSTYDPASNAASSLTLAAP